MSSIVAFVPLMNFVLFLEKMENEAQYDADGFVSIGELVKLLVKSFRAVRLGKND